MATTPVTSHLDLNLNQIINALLHPLAADPVSPVNGQVWTNTGEGRLKLHVGDSTKSIALLDDVTAGSITSALWDAQSVVASVNDDSPAAVAIGDGAFVGRPVGGNIGQVTASQAREILSLPTGTVANQTYVDDSIDALKGVIPAEFDTFIELLTEIQTNGTAIGTINTALAARTQKYSEDIGDGAATTITVSHNLGTLDVVFSMRPVSGGAAVIAEWEPVSNSAIEVRFNTAPTTGQFRVVVVG